MSSDISSSPTLRERSAAAPRSSGERQPLRRKITYVSIGSSFSLALAILSAELVECFLGRRLLRSLLRAARADAGLLAVDDRGAGEGALVRRPRDLEHRVGHLLRPARERLLQLGLVVDVTRER